MNVSFDNMMIQLKNSPAKSVTLGALLLVLVILVVRVFLLGSPKNAQARLAPPGQPAPAAIHTDTASQELERAAEQSSALWKTLRTRRGIAAQSTFKFDSSYYTAIATKNSRVETSGKQIVNKSDTKTADANNNRRDPAAETSSLILQSTATGTRPTAVINSQIVQDGDRIQGFTVVAIRAREVLLKKDGQTYTLEMGR